MNRYAGVVVGVLGVVLLVLAFVGPWWIVETRASVGGQTLGGTADFRLLGRNSTVRIPGGSTSETKDYSDSPNTGSVFRVAAALAGLALVCGTLLVIATALASSHAPRRRWVALLGVLAILLALIAPVYVMAELPNAVNRDGGSGGTEISGFWGSRTVSLFGVTATIAWNAGWSWYTTLLAAVVLLIATIASRRTATVALSGSPPAQS